MKMKTKIIEFELRMHDSHKIKPSCLLSAHKNIPSEAWPILIP